MNSCLALDTFAARKSFVSALFLLQLSSLPQVLCLLVTLTISILFNSGMAQWSLICQQCIACPFDNCSLSNPVQTLVMAMYLVAILCYIKLQSPDKSVQSVKTIRISLGKMPSHRSRPPLRDNKKLFSCFLVLLYVMLLSNAIRCHLQIIVYVVIDALDLAHHKKRVLVFEHSRQVQRGTDKLPPYSSKCTVQQGKHELVS